MASKEIPGIVALGAFAPDRTISNSYIAERLERSPEIIQRLMRRAGIELRHWVDDGQATSDLAIRATNDALRMGNIKPEEIKAIRVATMSTDYQGVPVSPKVAERVGAPTMGSYIDIQAACAGFIDALHTTYTDMTSRYGVGSPQVVVGAEVLSRHIHPRQKETYVLFGDAAGAVVIKNVPDTQNVADKITFVPGADGSHDKDLFIPAGGSRTPSSRETIEQGLHCLQMNGPLVKEHAIQRMAECVELVRQKSGLSYKDFSLFIPHQANLEIIDGVAKSLGFPPDRVYKNINRYGNTSAASIPVAMRDAYNEGRLDPDKMLLIASFGAGFEFAAAAISTSGLPHRSTVQSARSALRQLIPRR